MIHLSTLSLGHTFADKRVLRSFHRYTPLSTTMTSQAEFLQALQTILIRDAVADHTHGVMDNLPEAYSAEWKELADETMVKAGMQALSLFEIVVSPRPGDDPADRFPLGRRTM